MNFRLSGVGGGLETPCVAVVRGDVAAALRAARRMLDEHPCCDEIEIFAGPQFLRDVRRTPRRLVA